MTVLSRREIGVLITCGLAVFIWSAIGPKDRFTWFLEVAPVMIGAGVLAGTFRRFPLTRLVCWLILSHSVILMVGGHYTYAEVPLGFWFRDLLGLGRNHYDRLGHLAQGFIPAMICREVLLRTSPLREGKWLFALVCCVCLAFSATYELFEWAMAVMTGTAADAFLGTQGDPWDTQWDMLFALAGAILAQLLLGRWHGRQLGELKSPPESFKSSSLTPAQRG